MALTKRTYVDGETIITAQNLNDIQDEVIANGNNKANKSATVSTITYNSNSNHKLTKTINGTTTDVMTVDTIPTTGSLNPITSNAVYDLKDSVTKMQTLNILVIGNSFNQDIFAYVPKLLEEMIPGWAITYCVLYTSSATISQHLTWFSSNTKYTWANMWYPDSTAWGRYGPSSTNGLSLYEALNLMKWDMIFTQGTTSDAQTDAATDSGVIAPARKLLRTLQAYALGNFEYYTIEWLARGADVDTINSNYDKIHRSIIRTMNHVGFADYIPVGTAIQSARTNDTIKALGTGISMLYSDNVHIQAGQPALICANTVAAFIAKKCSEKYSLYKTSFSPSTANAIAINAKPADSDVGMTHGESLTSTTHVRRATQEIAYLALTNPNSVIDCSDIVVTQQSAPSQ